MDTEDSRFLDQMCDLLEGTERSDIGLAEFEPRFLHLHAEMPLSITEPSAKTIEGLFWVVEEFVAEPALRTASDPDEQAVLEAIGRCLARLRS